MELSYKNIFVAIVLAVFVSVLTSCHTAQPIAESHTVSDSVRVEVTTKWRDSLVFTKPDTIITKVRVICDSSLNPSIESSNDRGKINGQLKMNIHKGWLTAISICDSIGIELKMKEVIIQELRDRKETKQETIVVREQYIPEVVTALAWIGGLSLAIIIIILIIKAIK